MCAKPYAEIPQIAIRRSGIWIGLYLIEHLGTAGGYNAIGTLQKIHVN